jgi:hypothetical protein
VLVLALSRYQAGTAADLRDGLTTDRVNGAPALAVVHRQREET